MDKKVIKLNSYRNKTIDLFDDDRTHNILVILPELDLLEDVMFYYQHKRIIKKWTINTDTNSFIIDENGLEHIKVRLDFFDDADCVFDDIETFSLSGRYMDGSQDTLFLHPVAMKDDILFEHMKYAYGEYKSEAIIIVDYNDDEYDTSFVSMLGEKWYMIDYLRNIDFFRIMWWYRTFYKKFIRKIPDNYYMVNIKVEFDNEWYDII